MANDTAREDTVRADMEGIFGPPGAWYAAQDAGIEPRRAAGAGPGRRQAANGARMMVAAGACLLVAVGVGMASGSGHDAVQRAAGEDRVPAQRTAPRDAPAAYPAPATIPQPQPQLQPQIAQAIVAPAASGKVISETFRVAAVAPHRAEARSRVATAVEPAASTAARNRHGPDAFAMQRGTPVAGAGPDPSCRPDEDEDRCLYRDVLSADARLRIAYAAAARHGAPVGELAAIRRRWVRAHDLSLDQPDEAIRRYDELADALGGVDGDGPR